MSPIERTRVALISIAVLVGLILSAVLYRKNLDDSLAGDPNAQGKDVYATYRYGEPGTVYFGTQPLYSPTGLLTEAMRRDPVLREELEKIGFEVVFYPFRKGSDVNEQLVSGRLHVGVGGDMPALTAAATTNIVSPVMVQSGLTWLVTRTHCLLKDLKGERIAYAEGSNAHFMLLNLLSSSGLSETDVRLVPMDVGNMIEALDRGYVSAFAAWEPTPTIAVEKHGFAARFGGPSTGYMYFRRDFADSHPDVLRQIVAGVARACDWLTEGRDRNRIKASAWAIEASEQLTGENFDLSPEIQASIARKDIIGSLIARPYTITAESLADDGALAREHSFLKQIGAIPEESSWESVRESFDTAILFEILESRHEYRLSEFRYQDVPMIVSDIDRKE